MHSSRFLLIVSVLLAGCTAGSGEVACTMEAKICPDGSSVGRVPPSCEFAPCPAASPSSSADATVSDGIIALPGAPADFGFAVSKDQVLATAYIPPCEEGFLYCLYYDGDAYAGTNFESAGLGVTRWQASTAQDCLRTQPSGYSDLRPVLHQDSAYATAVYAPLGDAAMGHYAHDRLYRLSVGGACYDFRTRVGSSQFANYPEGSIKEFTPADESAIQAKLETILSHVTLATGVRVTFPAPAAASSN
jgi:hypothetical protein